jgi:hypothetical protein
MKKKVIRRGDLKKQKKKEKKDTSRMKKTEKNSVPFLTLISPSSPS